jgi:hypothetical protein
MSMPNGSHHTESTKLRMSQVKMGRLNPMYGVRLRGERNSQWKGGRRQLLSGYILIYFPAHPYCDQDGYVLEHRLVMENKLGRYLKPNEIVHHINGILDDNRIENLELFDNHSEHISIHAKRRKRNGKGQFLSNKTMEE